MRYIRVEILMTSQKEHSKLCNVHGGQINTEFHQFTIPLCDMDMCLVAQFRFPEIQALTFCDAFLLG